MSAICAVFRFDGAPVPAPRIAALLDALGEYGPESGSWAPDSADSPVALGSRPWRVTAEDAAYHPPLHTPDGQVVLVADARIDNRTELATALGIPPTDAREFPDARFILAAYQAWGLDSFRRLVGDFTFILWDQRKRALIAARDGPGQRVLFYRRTPHELALATTAHALTTLPEAPPRLNLQKVAEFLVLLPSQEGTFFDGILRLPPGQVLTATAAGMRLEPFWSPVPARRLVLGSDREYVEAFLEVFGEAVRSRLRSSGAVGIMASGGLDSSSVAVVAASQLREEGRSLPLYHAAPRAGFQGKVRRGLIADESAGVEAMARLHPNIDLRVRRPDGRLPFDDIEASFRMIGAPARNPTNVAWFDGIYAAARADGNRVLLAGHRGNATISYSGLRALPDAVRRGHWAYAWREAVALARATGAGRRDVLWDRVLSPLVPPILTIWARRLSGQPAVPVWDAGASAINPEFARTIGIADRVRGARLDQLNARRLGEVDFRIAALRGGFDGEDTYSGFRPWFGIETRDPTADRRVVEYCFAIPGSQYLRHGVTRSLIRRAMEGKLPDEIRNRTTIGAQGADWSEWLPSMRELFRSELDLLARSDTARFCLDLPRLQSLVDQWPARLGVEHEREYTFLLPRGLMMGRYIRWFESTYGTP
ncbi:MAG: asparagine synthetase B [Gemmatimonadales bacterium]|nr:MAG: asparagine synthetase B [Gemmatimonadales bacterium]